MADLFNDLLNSLDSLTESQINELLSRLEVKKSGQSKETGKNKQGIYMEDGQAVSCPACGSVSVKKHGKTGGKQRYYCKDCNATFNHKTGTMFYRSRLTSAQWKGIIEGLVLNLPLSKIADRTGLSINSVHKNKKKLCDMLLERFGEQDKQLSGIVECDEYVTRLSFKGKKDPNFFINMLDRMPKHHRSYAEKLEYLEKYGLLEQLEKNPDRLDRLLRAKGTSPGRIHEQACILTCKDRSDNLYINPVCIGKMENEHVFMHLTPKINPESIMVTDSYAPYLNFAEISNIHIEQILSKLHTKGAFNLGHINALHSRLSAFWPKGAGREPATKYIDLYLMIFWWLEKNKALSIEDKTETIYEYLMEQYYNTRTGDSLTRRKLPLDTKHLIPDEV